jgi:hypothetical protein
LPETGDQIDFAIASFGFGGTNGNGSFVNGLVEGDGFNIGGGFANSTNAVFFNLNSAGTTLNDNTNVILDGIAQYANAAALATAVSGAGSFSFRNGGVGAHNDVDILVAYQTGSGVNIARVDIDNTNNFTIHNTAANANVVVHAEDLVHLTGVTLASLDPHNIFFL